MEVKAIQHEVILASAGTGKTFQLTNRYLRLLAAGVPPERILATTFTRKAAGEILHRILLRLARAAADPIEAAQLAEWLHLPTFQRDDFQGLLRRVVENLHRLRVGTLDRLFAQIASAFAWELRLPAGWKMGEQIEADRLRDQSIFEVLRNETSGNIVRLLRLMGHGESAQSVHSELRSAVQLLHTAFRQGEPQAWQCLKPHAQLSVEQRRAALAKLRALPLPQKVRMINARDEDCDRFDAEDWLGFATLGISAKVLAGEVKYSRMELPPELIDAYRPLLDHAMAAVRTEIAIQTSATYELLEKYDEAFRRQQQRSRVYRFDDVVYLLNSAREWEDQEQQYLRLDASIEHLLLDEFQDTSLEQWSILRPLAKRIVTHSSVTHADDTEAACRSSFFCVGDTKQSIYGWRGGNSEILANLHQELPAVRPSQLNESRRSAPVIMDAVNAIFSQVDQHDNLEAYEEPVRAWYAQFPRHSTARGSLPGYVSLRTGAEGKDDESTFPAAADLVRDLCQAGPPYSIVVLVRNNAGVTHMADALRERGISVSEEGGTTLREAPGIPLWLAFFHWIDHPDDGPSHFHLANSPMREVLGLDFTDNDRGIALDYRRRLLDEGYGQVVLQLARSVAPQFTLAERLRLQQLVELAFQYQPLVSLRPRDFVEFVNTQRVTEPIVAAVRVMTIHQSKGLEFDTVILPQLHEALGGKGNPCIVGRDEPTGPIRRITVQRSRKLRPYLPSSLQRDYDAVLARDTHESLCTLYVALTRARHAMHLVVPPATSGDSRLPKTLAGLVLAAVVGNKPPTQPHQMVWQLGDPDWYQHSARGESPSGEGPATPHAAKQIVFQPPAASAPVWVRPSELAARTRIVGRERLRADATDGMRLGGLLHAWFEKMTWLDEAMPGPEIWQELARTHGITGEWVERTYQRALETLQLPGVAALFRQDFYRAPSDPAWLRAVNRTIQPTDQLHLRREQRFAQREGDQILHGTIDRIVLLQGDQGAIAADVLDFKSDTIESEQQLTRLVERYGPQVMAYRRAAQKLFGLSSTQVTGRLVFLATGAVISVGYEASGGSSAPSRPSTTPASAPAGQMLLRFEDGDESPPPRK